MKKIKRIMIIPARGNSKRIKNKNIKIFNGKPIIYYAIESAVKSNLFDKIHISTDSSEIKKIVKKKGIETDFLRPKKISGDTTPLMDVFKYVIEKYSKKGLEYDEVWSLMPCSPLIDCIDLKKVSSFYKKMNSKKPLLSISRYGVPIQWAYKMGKKKVVKKVNSNFHKIRSQDLTPHYFDAGQFVIFPIKFIKSVNLIKIINTFIGYELPPEKSIDIDLEEDWKLAEIIYRGLKIK